MLYMWRDKPVRELSRDELIEALEGAIRELEDTRGHFHRFIGFHRTVVGHHRGRT